MPATTRRLHQSVHNHPEKAEFGFAATDVRRDEEKALDQTSKDELKTMDAQILEATKQKENIRILLEEKKIASEVRKNIEEENSQLKNRIYNLQTKLLNTEEAIEEQTIQKEEMEFLKLNLLYGHKCRKTMFNKLYKVGTLEYKKCVLQKGKM